MSNAQKKQIARLTLFSSLLLVFLLLGFNTIFPIPKASASSGAARWTKFNIPADGIAGNWVLANGSDVQHLTVSADGTLYACGKGLPYTLYKSTDGGVKWSFIGQVQDAITGIAVSPHDPATIYYATASSVYRSANGGSTFIQMPAAPGGAGSGNVEITSMAVTWLDHNIIAVGTRDTDSSVFGGVYTLEETENFAGWMDTGIGAYDIYAVAFSPGYALDRDITAVATDETDTFVMSKIGDSAWNAVIDRAVLDKDNSHVPTSVAVVRTAVIAFPGSFNVLTTAPDRVLFIGIDTGAGEGDVYKVAFTGLPGISRATDLNTGSIYGQTNIDITGLAIDNTNGVTTLVAGSADSAQTYTSTDSGTIWTKSQKEPTGSSRTEVLFAPDFAVTGRIYAATSGAGSAFSVSYDTGATWNQTGLIDTTIIGIIDLAPSPNYSQDSTLFMVSAGVGDNLWRSQDGGNTWVRVFSSSNAGVDNLGLVILPPRYGVDCRNVLVSGASSGNPAVWESNDNGQSYRRQLTNDPAASIAFNVDTWAMAGQANLYIGSYNGSRGQIFQTSNGGFFYSRVTPVGNSYLHTLALSPDYEIDGNILVGNANGWVYLSVDNGTTFQPLPLDAAAPPFNGRVAVAFDPAFNANQTVYAASDNAGGGIYRFAVGQGIAWVSINATLPAGAVINRLAVSTDGILYALNTRINSGMERCLNPKSASPVFETAADGLIPGFVLAGLWQCDRRLWTVDTAHCMLMTYLDTLASPVNQVSPENAVSSVGSLIEHTVKNVTIDWETIDGATGYEWQCSPYTDFSSIPAGFSDTTSSSSVRLPALEPATTYYWRVRASAPVSGPWSPKWSFTTSLDTEIVALKPESPAAGAKEISIKPVFQWTAVIGADAYDLLVSTDYDFSHPVIMKTNDFSLPTNAWECDVSLEYDTTYYWKVRATASGTNSPWSSIGVFTTESLPVVNSEPTPVQLQEPIAALPLSKDNTPLSTSPGQEQVFPPSAPPPSFSQTPISSQLSSIPAWIVYTVGGLLAVVILVFVILLAVILKIKRIS